MRTVRFNQQAVAGVALTVFLVLCLISYFSTDQTISKISDLDGEQKNTRETIDESNRRQKFKTSGENRKEKREQVVTTEKTEKQNEEVEEKDDGDAILKTDESEDRQERIGKVHYEDEDNENDKRRQKVKEMMMHAWNGYKNYTWGANELRPVAKAPNTQNIFGGSHMPATIVDAADTLYLMDLKDEYEAARDYIKENFSMSKTTTTLSVFETTIRFLGGLLSLYALTGEDFYIAKAREVGEALLPAFNTPSGLPKSNLDVQRKFASNYGWANGGSSILAEVGSLHLEFLYLSRVAKAPIFEKKVKKVRDVLDKAEKRDGLYANYISADTGRFSQGYHVSLGALGDSFYEYLIKSWVQTNKTDVQARKMYWDVSEAIVKNVIKTSKGGLKYTAELRGTSVEHKMGHLACFVPGMFALQAANEDDEDKKEEITKLAEELGRTCHESYIRSATHIGPEMFYFNNVDEATSRNSENGYIQRPEVIEGWFYLWRLTGKQMYRDWVWDAVQSIEKYCRVENGYTGLRNVYDVNAGRDDVQQSFFLAETLKYAYLTFADTSLISLDKWVFNTEAHPFPVLPN